MYFFFFLNDNIVALLAKNAIKTHFNDFAKTGCHVYKRKPITSQSKR
jgi:hypothetical protein